MLSVKTAVELLLKNKTMEAFVVEIDQLQFKTKINRMPIFEHYKILLSV